MLRGRNTSDTIAAPQVIGALAGCLLIAGFWTPFAGVVAACAEAWIAFSSPAHPGIPAALAVLGVTLALIGRGEWSMGGRRSRAGQSEVAFPRKWQSPIQQSNHRHPQLNEVFGKDQKAQNELQARTTWQPQQ